MSGAVWVIAHECGWSRMVPRSTPAARRRQTNRRYGKTTTRKATP